MKYDELVKSLRELQAIDAECDGHYCGDCPNRTLCDKYSNGDLAKINGQAADAIEELRKPGWIPVSERLPEDGEKILVYVKRRGTEFIEVDQFCDDSDGTYLSSGYELVEEATHWMPLPSAPTEE